MVDSRKIAIVDLDTRQIETRPIPDKWRRRYIGGRGLGTYLACRFADPTREPLVISAGLLGGSVSGPGALTVIIARSPLTGFLECAFLPGRFAAEMRWAGFDHLVITGQSRRWASLFINDGTIRILNTPHLRGLGMTRVADQVRLELQDEDVKTIAIGPAGENRVRFATLADDMGRVTGRTGMGAVLGAKRIKALACRGTLDIEIKFPEQAILHRRAHNAFTGSTGAGEQSDPVAGIGFNDMDLQTSRQLADLGMDFEALVRMAQWHAAGAGVKPETDVVALADQIAHRKGPGRRLADGPLRVETQDGQPALPVLDLIALCSEKVPGGEVGSWAPPFTDPGGRIGPYRGKPGAVACLDLSLRLLDSLGDRTCAGVCPATGRLDLERVAELIRINTGREIKTRDLQAAAYRCYALERLFNLRAERTHRREGRLAMVLDTPGGLALSPSEWKASDLAVFRRAVNRYYHENGWDRKALVKKHTLERLGMAELWHQFK